jgi:hypothetical protein
VQLLAHVTTYEFGTGIAIFLAGVVIGQCVTLIGIWIAARRAWRRN